jgi:hypothetical protein
MVCLVCIHQLPHPVIHCKHWEDLVSNQTYDRKDKDILKHPAHLLSSTLKLFLAFPRSSPVDVDIAQARKPNMSAARFDQKFQSFNIIQTTYKTLGEHEIRADILVPTALSANDKKPCHCPISWRRLGMKPYLPRRSPRYRWLIHN